jgi:parallel beta-helix repeat protein/predicted outer membrane repeat protein
MTKYRIMKKIGLFLTLIFLATFSQASTQIGGGNVSGNWSLSGSPYYINGDIQIPKGAALIIQAGVKVEFKGKYKLTVLGQLQALGEANSFIEFTADDSIRGWKGIRFDGIQANADSSIIRYCKISYGKANSGNYNDKQGGGLFVRAFSRLLVENSWFSNNIAAYYGGAIACVYGSSPTFVNNIICNNQANSIGGGIYLFANSNPTFLNNTIVNNNASSSGGGIYADNSVPQIKNSIVYGNTAKTHQQIYPLSLSSVSYTNVDGGYNGMNNINQNPGFQNPSVASGSNYSGLLADWSLTSGSACINAANSDVESIVPDYDIDGNIRMDMDSLDMGALEYIGSTIVCGNVYFNTTWSGYVLVNCDLTVNNYVTLTIEPGTKIRFAGHYKFKVNGRVVALGTSTSPITFSAIYPEKGWKGVRFEYTSSSNDSSVFEHCIFRDGWAKGSFLDANGGGMIIKNTSKVRLFNCVFTNNRAVLGGGLFVDGCNPVVNNCLFVNNQAEKGGGLYAKPFNTWQINNHTIANNHASVSGGGLFVYGSNTLLYNSIVYGNTAVSNPQIDPSNTAVQYSCVESGHSGTGNISANPNFRFPSPSAGYQVEGYIQKNWALKPTSHCIDSGSSSLSGIYLPTLDISGKTRVYGNAIDMGAFEDKALMVFCDTIKSDTTWDANLVKVNCDIVIDEGVTLIIKPGTKVEFQGNYFMEVKGRILAEGNKQDSIIFTAANPVTGWGGIRYSFLLNVVNDSSKYHYCVFEYAKPTSSNGGAVYVYRSHKIAFRKCNFRYNSVATSGSNGGAIYLRVANVHIQDCKFLQNYAHSYGGAVYCSSSDAKIENNVFYKNTAANEYGGALYINTSNFPEIINNHITNNTAKYGGGIAIQSFTNASINGNVITNNTANQGGGLYIYSDCMPWLNNNTISRNFASSGGGGIYLDNNADPVLKNNILFFNTSSTSGNEIYINDVSSDPKIYYSSIASGKAGFGGSGAGINYNGVYTSNYSFDPEFIAKSNGAGTAYDGLSADWRLMNGSQAINAGTKDTVGLKLNPNDQKKNARIHNGRIDLGGIENQNDLLYCGHITTNTVWDADTIKVSCDLLVDNGVTLSIEEGTVVKFMGNYSLEVNGCLRVNGTANNNVLFTVADTAMFDVMDTVKGGWGGLLFNSVASTNDSSIIKYATFTFGKATGSTNQDMYGGALFIYNSSKIAFINCHFSNNRARYKGGAIYVESSSPVFMNNTISNNSAWGLLSGSYYVSYGGGLYLDDVNANFINNTIVNNEARNGGGAYLWASSPSFRNCIVYGNKSFTNLWYYGHQLSLSQGSIPAFYNCDIEGGLTLIPNYNYINVYSNNIDEDPYFYFPSYDVGADYDGIFSNWSIQSQSECINAGMPSVSGLGLFATDRAGDSRVVADTVDIGSYENQISEKFILQQPTNKTACVGDAVNFAVRASIALNYQWQKNGRIIPGATTKNYTIASTALNDSGFYSCIMSNTYGSMNSDTVFLQVNVPPIVLQNPQNVITCVGDSASFSVVASGTEPLMYQWYNTNGLISGATNAEYTIHSTSLNDASSYYCVVSNMCSSDQSLGASLTLRTSPSISSLSPNMSVCEDNSITFNANASGSAPISYQWYKDYLPISGATNSLYEILQSDTIHEGNYYCKASNICGADSTNISYLTVYAKPNITAQTSPTTSVCEGQSMTFSVTATGANPLNYQWYFNSVAIAGATNNTYTLSSAKTTDAGSYYCVVSNSCDSKTSDAILFSVKEYPGITNLAGNQSVCEGGVANLSITATGTSPLNYQWYFNNSIISPATNALLAISPVSTVDAGDYYCEVSNVCGSVKSNTHALAVKESPVIVSHTSNSSRCAGSQMTFSVNATGTSPIGYQWYHNNQPISKATSSLYSLVVDTADAGDYYCWVSNNCDSVKTGIISLAVKTKPAIITNPIPLTLCEDANKSATFSVSAKGALPIQYQWFVGSDSIYGATSDQLQLNGIFDSMANTYYCVVKNACGLDQSIPAALKVNSLPQLLTNTDTTTLCEGADLFMNVSASGTSPYSYQWYMNNQLIHGGVNSFHILSSIESSDAGDYYCEVSNVCGSVNSDVIQLNVNKPVSLLDQSSDSTRCEGESVQFHVNATGHMPLSYQWYGPQGLLQDDTLNVLNKNDLNSSESGFYYCEIENVCGRYQAPSNKLSVFANPDVSLGGDTVFCQGGSVQLSPGSGYFCRWNNGSINPQLQVNETGDYFVYVTDINGCSAYSDTVNVGVLEPFDGEEICLVSGDPATGKNMIAWERTKGKRTAYYKIYRESTFTGVYDLIGVRPFDSVSVFVDANSQPRQRAYRYAVSVVDSCGNESELSFPHKTIHLSVNQGMGNTINLIWSHYEGFVFGTYKIYRGTHPDSLQLIDSIQSNLNSYTDLNPPTGLLYYQVGVMMPDTCYPTILRAQTSKGPFSQSYSNMKDYSISQTYYLETNPSEISIAADYGASERLEVFTNLPDYDVSTSQSWLNAEIEEDKLGITITALSENAMAYARTAILTLSSAELAPVDILVYQRGTNGTIGLEDKISGELIIYPNPFSQQTNILLPEYEKIIHAYTLYDASGHVVRKDNDVYGNRIELKRESLAKGIYYIQVNASMTYTGKIVVY